MPRASAQFIAALGKSHRVYSRVEARTPGGSVIPLQLIDYSVTVDGTATTRRSGNVTFIDPTGTLAPLDDSGVMTPIGTELLLYRGIIYPDGTLEEFLQGTFMLSITSIARSVGTTGGNYGTGTGSTTAPQPTATVPTGGRQFQCQIYDRSRRISRDKFTQVYTIPSGTNIVSAIEKLVQRTLPDVTFDAVSSSVTTSAVLTFDVSNDPWQEIQTLAQTLGYLVYFDVEGDAVLTPPPDIDKISGAEYEYNLDEDNSTVLELDVTYSDDPGYNGVVVTGASISTAAGPVRAVAWDDVPTSPTYYLGPYGRVPSFYSDATITTVPQAQAMASSLLKGQLGFGQQVVIVCYANPSLDVGDVIYVQDSISNVASLFTITSITMGAHHSGIQTISANQNRTT